MFKLCVIIKYMSKQTLKKLFIIIFVAVFVLASLPFFLNERSLMLAEIEYRTYTTSFENISDVDSFYIVPQNHKNSASHELSVENVFDGVYAHKAWVYGPNIGSTALINNNHRAYPTFQFQKTTNGVFKTPCYTSLWVWVDMDLKPDSPENQWLSLATFTTDESDSWSRTILVNLDYDGYIHLMHVPLQGQKNRIYQNNTLKFPQKTWVHLEVYLDTRPDIGYAKVWQDGVLVSHAEIADGNGTLAQAHFGLYASPSVSSGTLYNDKLEIREVYSEEDVFAKIAACHDGIKNQDETGIDCGGICEACADLTAPGVPNGVSVI